MKSYLIIRDIYNKVYDRNHELVSCPGSLAKFTIDGDKEANMNKTSTSTGKPMESTGSTRVSTGSSREAGTSETMSMDVKIDWLIKIVKEMKDESASKKEVRMMIEKVEEVREKLGNIKQELGELRRMIQGAAYGPSESYSEAVEEKRKENIIVKPKVQQKSEVTKKLNKKIDIKNMGMTKLKKGSKGTVIPDCETGEEMKKSKAIVQAKLGGDFKVTESPQMKPKLKSVSIGEEEMKLNDDDFPDNTIYIL